MKTFILASSMAVLASGATIPKSKGVSELRKVAQTELKAHKNALNKQTTAEGKAALKEEKALQAKALVKEEGIVFTESRMDTKNKFEIRKGMSDCDNTVGMVDGFEMYRCVDMIWRNDSESMGYAESEMFVKPNNGGFPLYFWFNEHGCNFDNLGFVWRLPKTHMGFPPMYETGNCLTMTDDDGNPMFSQGAFWTDDRTVPNMPYGMQVVSNREPGCRKGKHLEYSSIAHDLCMGDEDDDGTVTSWKIDVSDCGNGNIIEKEYSDADCTTMVNSTTLKTGDCKFDYMEFFEDMQDMDEWGATAYLEYTSLQCAYGFP